MKGEVDHRGQPVPDQWIKMIAECVFDMTCVACAELNQFPDAYKLGELDSRDLFQSIYEWAHEFERSGYDPDDYLSEIEEFAEKKLREYFEGV